MASPSTEIQGVGPVVEAFRQRLEDDLNDAITGVNSVVTDSWHVDPIQDHSLQILPYVPVLSQVKVFPCVGIQRGPRRMEDDIGTSATGIFEIAFLCFNQVSEPEGLALVQERFALAVERCVMNGRRISGTGVWGITHELTDYGPALAELPQSGDGPPVRYMTWSAVMIRAKAEEE